MLDLAFALKRLGALQVSAEGLLLAPISLKISLLDLIFAF